MSLVSVATLREYLPEIGSSTAADTELTALILRVETFIARWLGYPPPSSSSDTPTLNSSTYVLYLDGPLKDDRLVLQLPVKPISALNSIHSDTERRYESSSLLTLSNIDIDAVNGRLIIKPWTSTAFDSGYRSLKVNVTAGYDGTPPTDLVHAICVWCSQLHRQKQNQGKEQISQQGSSVRLSMKSMPSEVKEILYKFRVPLLVL
mgnify:FL=1